MKWFRRKPQPVPALALTVEHAAQIMSRHAAQTQRERIAAKTAQLREELGL